MQSVIKQSNPALRLQIVYAAIDANDKEAAKAALVEATATIDKATSKGVYHKNTSSRKVSRLAKSVNEMA